MSHIIPLNYTAILQFFILRHFLKKKIMDILFIQFFLYFPYVKSSLLDTVYFQPQQNTTTFLH
jgi:hypothetical protein